MLEELLNLVQRILTDAKNYFIVGDDYLCPTPLDLFIIKPIYRLLLQVKNKPTGLVFCCLKKNIALSIFFYDLDVSRQPEGTAFRILFQQANYYDDFLKNKFGYLDRLEK
jgi:serine protease Do